MDLLTPPNWQAWDILSLKLDFSHYTWRDITFYLASSINAFSLSLLLFLFNFTSINLSFSSLKSSTSSLNWSWLSSSLSPFDVFFAALNFSLLIYFCLRGNVPFDWRVGRSYPYFSFPFLDTTLFRVWGGISSFWGGEAILYLRWWGQGFGRTLEGVNAFSVFSVYAFYVSGVFFNDDFHPFPVCQLLAPALIKYDNVDINIKYK